MKPVAKITKMADSGDYMETHSIDSDFEPIDLQRLRCMISLQTSLHKILLIILVIPMNWKISMKKATTCGIPPLTHTSYNSLLLVSTCIGFAALGCWHLIEGTAQY